MLEAIARRCDELDAVRTHNLAVAIVNELGKALR